MGTCRQGGAQVGEAGALKAVNPWIQPPPIVGKVGEFGRKKVAKVVVVSVCGSGCRLASGGGGQSSQVAVRKVAGRWLPHPVGAWASWVVVVACVWNPPTRQQAESHPRLARLWAGGRVRRCSPRAVRCVGAKCGGNHAPPVVHHCMAVLSAELGRGRAGVRLGRGEGC